MLQSDAAKVMKQLFVVAPFVISTALRGTGQCYSSNAASTFATDRPQITNSSIAVPCGSLQFENGFEQASLQIPGDIDHNDALIASEQEKQLE